MPPGNPDTGEPAANWSRINNGVAELIEDMALLGPAGEDVPGLASSSIAIAFLAIWLLSYSRGRPSMWTLWGAAIFGVVGIAQLSGRLVGVPSLGALWPA